MRGNAQEHRSDLVRILATNTFFADLTAEQLERLAPLFRTESYPQGAEIYNLGDRARDFYVLVDGLVNFTIGLGAGRASSGEVIRSGQVFGWAAIVETAQRRIATAYCMTPCEVLAVEGDAFLGAMDRDHSLGYRIMKQLTLLITGELTAFASG